MGFSENNLKKKYLNENNLFIKSLNFQLRQTRIRVMVLTLTHSHDPCHFYYENYA